MAQEIIFGEDSCTRLSGILRECNARKFLLVCGSSFDKLPIRGEFDKIESPFVRFGGFSVNPSYEEVVDGVALYRKEGCDCIVAVGGGSAMDVAKCIKLYAKMPEGVNYMEQPIVDTGIPLIAIPTTAGTGSESTRFAVIYYKGEKQSVRDLSIIPNYALLVADTLTGLPLYQKKCTLLDAYAQAIEAFWSVNSTKESEEYATQAIERVVRYAEGYLSGDKTAREEIMLASNYAGRAINITQTTAPHAMSYKLTTLYGLPHGHAVAVCLPWVWQYMLDNLDKCIDGRGKDYLASTFARLAKTMGCDSPQQAIASFFALLNAWGIENPIAGDYDSEMNTLAGSVNTTRLKNNPVALSETALYSLYKEIVKK